MQEEMLPALAVLSAYLLGSIPFGVIVARAHGVDLQKVGSGNIGATNAARAMGKGVGVLVLLLDAAKATLPVWLCGRIFVGHPQRAWILAAVSAAALCGHVFPFFLRFHGGKGVATAFGALVALSPPAALLGLVTYALCYGWTRISSVGSLSALLLLPLWLYLFHAPLPTFCFAGFAFFLVVFRHTGNIRRLLSRQESKL
jgi:glycerol-3-phosphate acyltransferase PlsY